MVLEYYTPRKYTKPQYYDCPHNEGCRCKLKDCGRCGWNPKVAAYREAKIKGKLGVKING